MSMSANEIESMIKEALPDSVVVIEDLRGDGDHYSAHVKSVYLMESLKFSNIKWFIKL